MTEPFEVITVPDFAGRARDRFEARTILFLASWMENAGAARDLPLHVACIGEPPDSVRRWSERAGALVSTHEPMTLASATTANKLRGLEVEPRTERHLLVDTDVVFLGDISSLQDLPDCISAAPGSEAKVPMALWRKLYTEMGLGFPEDRMPLMRVELDMPPIRRGRERFDHQNVDVAHSPPYYNSGVVFAAWKHDLRTVWADSIVRGAEIVDPSEEGADGVLRSDQAGLALAVATLRARGVEFRRLPEAMHGRWRHLYGGTPTPGEMRILHTTGIMKGLTSPGGFSAGHPEPIDTWYLQTRSRLSSLLRADVRRGRPLTGFRRFRAGRRRTEELHEKLLEIYRNQVADAT